jgi:predicted PurR-regulated permease PerM
MMRPVNKLPKWLLWILAFPLAVLYGWLLLLVFNYLQPLLSIFLASILLSFVLNYPVKFLQKKGVIRQNAVTLVFLITLLILLALAITLVPIIWQQLNEFAKRLPYWIDSGSVQLEGLNRWAGTRNIPIDLRELALQLTNRLSEQLQTLTGKMLGFAIDTIGSIFNVFLAGVLTDIGPVVRRSLRQNFHNYFIGQISLAAISGVAMTLAFLALQVPLALLFGFGLGLMALFPLLTGIGIALVSLLLALQNFWLGIKVLLVAILIDQINANFIAPRVLGGFTGLNPVWIIISLLLGAKLGGVLGLLIAVPLASFIKNTSEMFRTKGVIADDYL